jgi:hypothetical protein
LSLRWPRPIARAALDDREGAVQGEGVGEPRWVLVAVGVAVAGLLLSACYGSHEGPDSLYGDAAEADGDAAEDAGPPPIDTWVVNLRCPTIAEYGTDLTVAPDGSFYAAGLVRFTGGLGGSDAWVAKTDATGNLLWQTIVGGPGNDYPSGILRRPDGTVALVGGTDSFGDGGGDAWVVLFDEAGAIRWQRTIGDAQDDDLRAGAVLSDGGLVLVGDGWASSRAWVVRVDGDGSIMWQKRLTSPAGTTHAASVVATPDGGCLAAGPIQHPFAPGGYATDYWIGRFDSAGELVWQRKLPLDDRSGGHDDEPQLVQLADGGVLLLGSSSLPLVIRLDNAGELVWQRTYPDGPAWLYAGLENLDGTLIVVGSRSFDDEEPPLQAWFLTLDAGGDIRRSVSFAGDWLLAAQGLVRAPDGGIGVLAGSDYDAWLFKLDAVGAFRGTCSRFTERHDSSGTSEAAMVAGDLTVADDDSVVREWPALTMDAGLVMHVQCPD